jgi:predicted RecA/RadA family phage recombinase
VGKMEKKKRILLKTVGTIGAASVGIISAISIPKTINTIKNQIIKSDENVVVGDTFILDVQDLTSAGFNSDDVMSGNLKFTIQTLDLDSGTGTVSLADNTQSVYVNES